MNDIYSKKKRSEIMSQISGKETQPEIILRKYLFSKGFRFRKNDPRYPGKPDIVLPKYKTMIFVNGCFWHGHKGCKAAELPKTRREFWENKINENVLRDARNIKELFKMDWKIIVVWQCEITSKSKRETKFSTVVSEILMANK